MRSALVNSTLFIFFFNSSQRFVSEVYLRVCVYTMCAVCVRLSLPINQMTHCSIKYKRTISLPNRFSQQWQSQRWWSVKCVLVLVTPPPSAETTVHRIIATVRADEDVTRNGGRTPIARRPMAVPMDNGSRCFFLPWTVIGAVHRGFWRLVDRDNFRTTLSPCPT